MVADQVIAAEIKQNSVLLVDDDTSVCEAFRRKLVRHGYTIHTAHSYQQAAAILREHVFDAIVSDIFLGDKDGIDLLEKSRKLDPDTPVILVTGLPTVETASAAVHLNAYEYLLKPVSLDKLAEVVDRAVRLKSLRAAKKRLEIQNKNYQRDLEQLVAARTKKLIESNQRYQLLFENSKDAIYMAAWNGHFLALNYSAQQLFGYPLDDLLKKNTIELYADRSRHETFQQEIEHVGFVKDFAVRLKRRDGSVIDCLLTAHLLCNGDGEIEGHQGIIRDITEQKRAEEKIRKQNAFLTNVLESLSHPFMVIDAEDFGIRIANAAARQSNLTRNRNTCYGLFRRMEKPCSLQGYQCPVEEVVRTGKPAHVEHAYIDADGREGQHEMYAFPLLDNAGKVVQVIQYCIDITEKKRLESIAEAANLMENLGYIFSGIRHEIGNPLNSVKMALSVLSMNLDRYPKSTVKEFVDRALGEASRVEYLLKALKNFSLFESPNVEPVVMQDFLNNFLSLVEKDFSRMLIKILVDIPTEKICALTDHRAFHQVLLNLLTNAADALEKTETPRIVISVKRLQEGMVQVEVADNGRGITPDEQRNLFRPFYTSKAGGTGLGLVIVKKMLAKMNSTVRVESQPGKGTTVTMILPEATECADEQP